jgi:hypothetical protein
MASLPPPGWFREELEKILAQTSDPLLERSLIEPTR